MPPQCNFVLNELESRPYYPRPTSHVEYALNWREGVQKENSNKTDWRTGHDLSPEEDGVAMMRISRDNSFGMLGIAAPVEAEERLTMGNACLVNCRLGCLPYLGKTGKSLIVSLVISLATGFTIYANGRKKSIQCGQQLPADQSVYYANSKRPNNHNEIIDVLVPTRADANKILLQLPRHHQVYSSASPSQPFYVAPRKQYRITLIHQSNVNPPEVYFINYKANKSKSNAYAAQTNPEQRYEDTSKV
ncbi:hypothetical protein GQX74_000128 [Glossina fuscipes]|nr:hypothetical protein GQX74_000128 [Glossina fuscipes]